MNPSHIKDLVSDKKNRRKHNPRNVGMVVDALHKVGAARSIVIDEDNVVLAGNGVLEAAGEAGITKVQVVDADGSTIVAVRRTGLTDGQKRDLAIYDNRTAELADWDLDQIRADLDAGEDLSAFFRDNELAALLASEAVEPVAGLTDPDAVPAERATDIKPGDLFELGKHRLLCGDSTKAGDVARLMDGRTAKLGLHDPPYGIAIVESGLADGKRHGNAAAARSKFAPIIGDSESFDPSAVLQSAAVVVLWGANHYADRLPARPSWIVWDKRVDLPSNGFSDCELAWVSEGGSARIIRHMWNGMIRASEMGAKRIHPTQKPVAVQAEIIAARTDPGDTVCDWYAGSGSTLIAAEQSDRQCCAAEISPAYVQAIIDRWEAFTGSKAVKVGESVVA